MPPWSQIQAQCEPFGRECRVFARLKEIDKEHLAARCYGYLVFDAAMERRLAHDFGLDDWGRDAKAHPEWENRPLHAIVKEFLPDVEFTPKDVRSMISTVKELHRAGIVVDDIKYDAYVGTKLVDFSFAITMPHIRFDDRMGFNRKFPVQAWADLCQLDRAFDHWNRLHKEGPAIWVRSMSNYRFTTRLRSWKAGVKGEPRREPWKPKTYDPREFDWRKHANEWTKIPRRSARIQKSESKRKPAGLAHNTRVRRKRAEKQHPAVPIPVVTANSSSGRASVFNHSMPSSRAQQPSPRLWMVEDDYADDFADFIE